MNNKWLVGAVLVFLMLVILPLIIEPSGKSVDRNLSGVSLSKLSYQEIEFINTQQNLNLAGMLFIPEGAGPFPAAVIIHGSGYSHRDNIWYLTLTAHLQQNGIAVLLPDKRGSEQSDGDWETASLEDLATDTTAAVTYLQNQDLIQISSLGVIGMSQGGMIAPIAADLNPNIDFLVNVVGGAVPMYRGLIYEEKHNLQEIGFLPLISDLLAYPAAWSLICIRQTDFWDAVGNFDPLPYWEKLTISALVLYGADDTNVPTRSSARRLGTLGKSNIRILIFDGSGHALESPQDLGNSIFREEALNEISTFINSIKTP